MHNCDFISELKRRLVKRGLAAGEVERRVKELADHFQDLKEAAMAQGLSEEAAEVRAAESLGKVELLAEQMAAAARESHWHGRHRFLAFCVLPPLGLAALLLITLFTTLGLVQICVPNRVSTALTTDPLFPKFAVIGFGLVKYVATGLAAFVFCRMAQRSATGFGWILAGSGLCALHSYLMQANASAHSFSLGYSSMNGDVIGAVLPLLVAFGFWVRQKRREQSFGFLSNVGVVCLAGVLMTGCASKPKPVHERGWIGGSYVQAKTKPASTNVNDKNLGSPQTGLLLSDCSTNTPVYVAGLRKGDMILKLGDKRVKSISQLNRIMSQAKPGAQMSAVVYRDMQVYDYQFRVGREKYNNEVTAGVGLPTIVRGWDLWPNPGFSLVFLGYEPYYGEVGVQTKENYVNHWSSWLVIFEVSKGWRILSQEVVQ